MRIPLFLAAALGILVAGWSPAAETPEKICVVALGDSITRGARPAKGAIPAVLAKETFCSLLQAELALAGRPAKVINSGVPSNRTDQAVTRLDADVLSHKPDWVLIMYGTNDSCHDKDQPGPRLALEEYEKNLHHLISAIRQAGGSPILMTPPPLKEGWGMARHSVYVRKGANGAILAYVEACRRVAAKDNVPLVDHFAQWTARGPDFIKSLLPDGCHPNAHGHKVLAEAILPVLLANTSPETAVRSLANP